jgi:hypothetical protein
MDMKPLRTSLFVLLLLSSFSTVAVSNDVAEIKRKVTITTFNIAFYGTGGKLNGTPEDEKRDPYLKSFIKNSIPISDIFVFEEIVDVPRVKTLLPADWNCLSYESRYASHQHVVLCHSDKYTFIREATDDNDVIDEVAGERGTLRPALTAIVADQEGNQLFRIVGVHLKATPTYAATRISQAGIKKKTILSLS